jgi:hypothetical protein
LYKKIKVQFKQSELSRYYKTQLFYAHAVIQRFASFFMAARRIVGEAFVLKSLVFRSFQIVQLTRMVREAKTFRFEIGTLNMPIHQSMSREGELDKLQQFAHACKQTQETAMHLFF